MSSRGPQARALSSTPPEDRRDDAGEHQDLHLAPLGLCGHRRKAGLHHRAAGRGQSDPGGRHVLVCPVVGGCDLGGAVGGVRGSLHGGAGHGNHHHIHPDQDCEDHPQEQDGDRQGLAPRVSPPLTGRDRLTDCQPPKLPPARASSAVLRLCNCFKVRVGCPSGRFAGRHVGLLGRRATRNRFT